MSTERFARVKEILLAARSLPGPERSAYLDRACAGDAALRAEVDSLLAHDADAPALLETGALAHGLAGDGPNPEAAGRLRRTMDGAPETVGPYRILDVLGEGGMGVVYRAEQTEPLRREVALKLVRRGMDSERVAARFAGERQALALMEHPNIARVLDAGEDGGRPYFVMELVRGEPITAFCDRERLGVRERLRLFLDVCDAVEHAHRKGILHRDLKPSNVLAARVEGRLTVKVIDFGIAKALQDTGDPATLLTREGQFLGTPEYMSPEQAGVIPGGVDTRSDVYSLGVLLYELLAGRRPHRFRTHSPGEIQRILAGEGPERPSTAATASGTAPPAPSEAPPAATPDPRTVSEARGTTPQRLRRMLSGDLDTIILTALRKEPARRYGSVERLAEDLRRHLDGRPVLARGDTWTYRAGKFARRHRVGVGATAVVAAALVAVAVTTAVQSARTARERDRALAAEARAETEAETARRVSGFLEDLFRVSDPVVTRGDTLTAREILDRGSERVARDLAGEPQVQAELLGTLSRVYRNLGLSDRAASLAGRESALADSVHGPDSLPAAAARSDLASARAGQGDYAAADSLYRRVLADQTRLLGPDALEVGRTVGALAVVVHTEGNLAEAESLYARSYSLIAAARGERDPETANALGSLGAIFHARGELDTALVVLKRTLDLDRDLFGADDLRTADAMSELAVLLKNMDRPEEAEPYYRQALAVREKVLGDSHPLTAQSLNNLAVFLRGRGRSEEAARLAGEAVAAYRRAYPADHMDLAIGLSNYAGALADAGRFAAAESTYTEAIGIARRSVGPDHWVVAALQYNLGKVLLERKRYRAAEAQLVPAYRSLAAGLGPDSRRAVRAAGALSELYEALGRPAEAARYRALAPDESP